MSTYIPVDVEDAATKKPPTSVRAILEAYMKDISDSLTVKHGKVTVDWKKADADLRHMTSVYAEAEIKRMIAEGMGPKRHKRRKKK